MSHSSIWVTCLQTQSRTENIDERRTEQKEILSLLYCIWERYYTYPRHSQYHFIMIPPQPFHSLILFTLSYSTLILLYSCCLYIFMWDISETAFMFSVFFYLKKVICFSCQFQLSALSLMIKLHHTYTDLFSPYSREILTVLLKFTPQSWKQCGLQKQFLHVLPII